MPGSTAVLDACVLVPAALRDTLLRLAEGRGGLYTPKWSAEIFLEVTRTLEAKLGWPSALTAHRARKCGTVFPELGWMATSR